VVSGALVAATPLVLQDEATFQVVDALAKALHDTHILGASGSLRALLAAVDSKLAREPQPLAALPASGPNAAFLLCRLQELGLAHTPAATGSSGAASAREEVPLATLLTRRVAVSAASVPPGLLMRAAHASTVLLGYLHVPLAKVRGCGGRRVRMHARDAR
jgi:hypothetical protein